LGLRNAKALTGIRVRHVHFSASGEGKRWETNGHNTDIRYFTPANEVEAQLFGGGIEGSFPVLLDFHYDNEVLVKLWEVNLAYHDFELHENGDIMARKSYGIGHGKRTSKADLDKLYTLQWNQRNRHQ
jgi:hypothetical protein